MPVATDEIVRQMAGKDLKLVWYHTVGGGKKNLNHLELQSMNVRALNTTSMGFRGPTSVPRELLTELLQLKLVEKVAAPSDASQSVFHLTDAGRAHARKATVSS
jgi:hypothetical protein